MESSYAAHAVAPPRSPAGFFWFVSQPRRGWIIASVFLVVIATVLTHSTGYFLKLIVEAVEGDNSRYALGLALAYPMVIFISELLYRGSGYTVRRWAVPARKLSYDVLSTYLTQHSHRYFSNRFAGSLLSKINNVVGAIEHLIPELMWTHLTSLVSFLVTLAFFFSVNTAVALTFALLALVLVVFNRALAPEKRRLARANAESATTLRARIVDVISNVQAMRQYARSEFEISQVAALSEHHRERGERNWAYTEMMLFWNGVILFIFSLAMFWLLIESWRLGMITTGDLVLVITLYSQMTYVLVFIGRALEATARTIGEMQEGLDDILVPYDIVDRPDARPLDVTVGSIEWRDVDFTYDSQSVFSRLSLAIGAGERIGLVGPSGAGKTTFVSLLLREHELSNGLIMIDGQNIAHVTQNSLREQIAVVPQEPALFHRSIIENIRYGNPGEDDAAVIAAARKARVDSFVRELPEGYDTLVGERGVKLSGGQKQRIAIARAILKNAPILVLDEATSALDSESEVAIQEALHELMVDKTVIAIAHRLSTLREMDRIIVLEEGKIVEEGSHDTLAHAGGQYQRLWEHQAGGFLTE